MLVLATVAVYLTTRATDKPAAHPATSSPASIQDPSKAEVRELPSGLFSEQSSTQPADYPH